MKEAQPDEEHDRRQDERRFGDPKKKGEVAAERLFEPAGPGKVVVPLKVRSVLLLDPGEEDDESEDGRRPADEQPGAILEAVGERRRIDGERGQTLFGEENVVAVEQSRQDHDPRTDRS